MGIDYNVYVGPFVLCQNEVVDVEKTRRSCTNKKCSQHKNDTWGSKFCNECGSAIDNVIYKSSGNRVDADPELVKEKMVPCRLDKGPKNADIWHGNLARKVKGRSFGFDPKHDNVYQEITLELIAAEITEFIDQYRDSISILRAAYGLENVEIKWGLFNYFS